MRLPLSLTVRLPLLFVLALFAAARCPAQALPDLGDSSQAVFTPTTERRLGESIMERVRRDRAYMDDPVITDYLASLGNRLVSASPDSRQSFEFFLLNDPSVNAFALPGGFIGVHTGLILIAQTESELAGVLAHEVAHVTQRHIARMIAGQERSGLATLAALAIGLVVVQRDQPIERRTDGSTDPVDRVGAGDEHEVVAGDVTDEVTLPALARHCLANDVPGLPDHCVGLGVTVVIVECLEVVQIEVAERVAAFREAALDLVLDGTRAGELGGR